MRPYRGAGWSCALMLFAAWAGRADAAWDNVFQVCCASCRGGGTPSVSAYAAPTVAYAAPAADGCTSCASPCTSCPTCTTRYVQRCYYQPVTAYKTSYYYEPVTTYKTSYYYEPVTSYRYSYYYDPSSCNYQQVACPTTSYQMKSQSCPVQSFVQRSCQVPTTAYQQSFYYEPVTSCSYPTPTCPTPACQPTGVAPQAAMAPGAGVAESVAPGSSYAPQAGVAEQRAPASTMMPGVQEYRGGAAAPSAGAPAPQYDRNYSPETMPPTTSSYRQVAPRRPAAQRFAPAPAAPVAPTVAPTVRLDRVVSLPSGAVEGTVVGGDRRPQSFARLAFVSERQAGPRQEVTANQGGQFRVALTSGNWLVYSPGVDGKLAFHRKIEVRDSEVQQVTLLSR